MYPMVSGMTCLKEMDLSRCSKVTDAGVTHLLSIPTLEKIWLSETGVTAEGVSLLSSLPELSVLDLGGLPVTDQALSSLLVCKVLFDFRKFSEFSVFIFTKNENIHENMFGSSKQKTFSIK